jgi:hypothetical protein
MKLSEVPQDNITTLRGEKKLVYAVDDQGRYTGASTRGWEVEETVLTQVIGDFEERAAQAAVRVRDRETSPIEYFMHKSWMDPLTLAQAMGLCRWQVRRHFKPGVFRKLSEETLGEYARVFRIPVDALKHFPEED